MTATGIVFLQKDKFDLYSPNLTKIIEFRFVPEIVRDLEVVNPDLLGNLIKLFVENNKVAPSEMIIVLSDNACFVKDFVLPPRPGAPQKPNDSNPPTPISPDAEAISKQRQDIEAFIDHVPFENVTSREFPTGNGTKVLAVNGDFFEVIKLAFENVGFKVKAVYPGLLFANNIGSKPVLDIIAANSILQQEYALRDNNLLREKTSSFIPIITKEKEQDPGYEISESNNNQEKPSKKRLFVMIGIFAFLIVVLIVVYLNAPK